MKNILHLHLCPAANRIYQILHSLIIISLLMMIGSGLTIYNANPVFGGRDGWHIPPFFTLGGWLAGGRDWHFYDDVGIFVELVNLWDLYCSN